MPGVSSVEFLSGREILELRYISVVIYGPPRFVPTNSLPAHVRGPGEVFGNLVGGAYLVGIAHDPHEAIRWELLVRYSSL